MKKIFIIYILAQFVFAGENDSTGTIIFSVVDFRNNKGKLHASLFSAKDGFPGEFKKAHINKTIQIENQKSRVVFENIKYGEYAVGFLHDENLDDKLNTNWFGMPKEGIAVSNNAKDSFGPPDYSEAKFILKTDTLQQIIYIEY